MSRYRKAPQTPGTVIGCNILAEPFFLPEEDWIPIPSNWTPSLQTGLTYDTANAVGAALWEEVALRVAALRAPSVLDLATDHPRYGSDYLARARIGQGTFRALVTDAYHRRCAVTGEKSLPALEAAHIRAHAADGPNRADNGLLLRADIHRLFDDGYVTVDPDLRFVVSPRLREEFENGREYYRLDGNALANLPDEPGERPLRDYLDWHNSNVYVA